MALIYLYCLTSSKDQLKEITLPFKDKVKKKLKLKLWYLRRYFNKKFSWKPGLFVGLYNSNKGDIAIRMSIEELLNVYHPNTRLIEITWGKITADLLIEINQKGNIFLIGGSGFFICNARGDLCADVGADIQLLRKVEIPIVYYSVGYNLNIWNNREQEIVCSDNSAKMIRELTCESAITSVRDKQTYDLFRKIGIKNLTLVPDPVIFLKPVDSGVRLDKNLFNVGFNLAIHGGVTKTLIEKKFVIYVKALSWLKNEFCAHVVYFKHEEYENIIIKELKRLMLIDRVVDILPGEMLDVYKQLDIHICQMMHSSIMAFNQNIPTINLAYDIKNFAFFDLMKQSKYCLKIHGITEMMLIASIKDLIKNKATIKKEIMKEKDELWAMERDFLISLKKLL